MSQWAERTAPFLAAAWLVGVGGCGSGGSGSADRPDAASTGGGGGAGGGAGTGAGAGAGTGGGRDGAPHWVDVWGGGDTSFTTALRVAVDASDNAYVIGTFGPTADFQPGPGVVSKVAMPPAPGTDGPARDAYLLKLDARHEVAWVRTWGGSGYDYANDVAVDAQGNVFVTGYFYSDTASIVFDPPAPGFEPNGAASLQGTTKAYVLEYDAEGTFQWARTWSTNAGGDPVRDATLAFAIAVDEAGNVDVAGDYDGAVDFDGTSGVDVHDSATEGHVYLVSYTPSGAYRWARTFGSGRAQSLASDHAGGLSITGSTSGVADWDPTSGVLMHGSPDEDDIFTGRFLTDGTFRWCRFVDGKGHANAGRAIVADASGNVYVGGSVGGDDDAAANDVTDVVVLKYAEDGSSSWSVRFGGALSDVGLGIALDPAGGVAVSGLFEGTVDFDPGAATALRTAAPESFFVTRFDASGIFQAITTGGPAVGSGGLGLAFDKSSQLFVAGAFWGTADFDPGDGVDNRTSLGNADAFLWYLRPPP